MFSSIKNVHSYEKALKILATPKFKKIDIWLHDYDDYKNTKLIPSDQLERAYSEWAMCIVDFLTGSAVDGSRSYFNAYFAGLQKWIDKHPNYGKENSRFVKVRYSKVKTTIEDTIKKLLKKAKLSAEAEIPALENYTAHVKAVYGKYLPAVLRITIDSKGCFYLTTLKPKAFITRGGGNFLDKIKKGDVSISKAAFKALAIVPGRGGMIGFEIFHGPVLMTPSTGLKMAVPKFACSVQKGAWPKFAKLVKVEE